MKFIDLTHTFTQSMFFYSEHPVPELVQIADFDKQGYIDHQIKTSMHVGTHIDAPFHMLKDGKRLSQISIDKFFGIGHLIDARGKKEIEVDLLDNHLIEKGDIVFILTGFYKKFGHEDYFRKHPGVSYDFTLKIIDLGVKIFGLDTPGPDSKIHKLLFEHEILIIENLTNLESLLGISQFEVFALPPKFDTEAAPVRVIARIV